MPQVCSVCDTLIIAAHKLSTCLTCGAPICEDCGITACCILVAACKGTIIRKSHIALKQLSLLNEELRTIPGNQRWVVNRKFLVFSDHHPDWVESFWSREAAETYVGHLLTHKPNATLTIRET